MAPNILAADAAGDALTVALEAGGQVLTARRGARAKHDESLLPAVESLLKRAGLEWEDLDAVAVPSGPGRFTGIRIGMAFAAMAGMKLKISALALSRLETAAEKCSADDILAALPGWKKEVYSQLFRRKKSGLASVEDAAWTAPDAWPALQAQAEAKGATVAFHDTDARDLLAPARRRLASGKFPPFKPFYLKPAGYERPGR
ncbi:MAG TPA: tRNA (adenosine(37)-N6)-threonylcarbamoyltransferase complex dimerization subunit type 1 TsaB [Elusimicrobia bacterium]|nr:MAG: tRNA (adenosine(37)-N6)-threonylcarbamoyltransferase complex dimerization subunit type 1 TsaB [Elusimicrobia bacterium GWA2_66_18]OGR77213.1 MAG: tRNA (adenosine(37)-N6)-threonylcarbamoyltransferase complex dimerization subunit type 1 TsaB [Elusimicrobia bacterium GWC2_65_9]HAZ09290.1 tRNA (adenosine(37)-N6)-threonylcarbamoyltransferase complex dimerization subunit type 1 TsaB [Elusimicrobiota bacterium]